MYKAEVKKVTVDNYQEGLKKARGLIKADLVLKNAKVFMSHTGEFVEGDVAIAGGVFLGVGEYVGEEEIDLAGKWLVPGLIDSHLHVESTLVTPSELVAQATKKGTTTFIVDPHESANVSGTKGIDYILEETEDAQANVYVMMPSCVPSTHVDDNGAHLSADKMAHYLDNPRILGLGEVMDATAVITGDSEMTKKLELFRDKVKDGHAPFLSDKDLAAYTFAGITTDHECVVYEYAMKECRSGMYVLIREGSAARNLEAIVTGIVENQTDTSGFCFCTDDKHIEEIHKEGHINYNVKRAVELGLPIQKALQMATIQAARCYGLKHLGAIAPGYQADFVVLDDLEEMQVHSVYFKGKVVSDQEDKAIKSYDPELKNTIRICDFTADKLVLDHEETRAHVIQMFEGQIITEDSLEEVPYAMQDGKKVFSPDDVYQKIAVVERHKHTGMVGVGIVKGFGIRGGAIASSVSHDSHNIIVAGDNDSDMMLAVEELMRTGGGYTIVCDGKVYETLPLPIMGLMSDEGYKMVDKHLERMIPKAHAMGIPEGMEPFITLSFMALPVIPEIRITPRGTYLVKEDRMLKSPFI
ncbi:adenine deaminase [Ohessyouella blattaphilus]|uniref:Adenine deaminase n=1 Tax=Ohessyouella blattaphilus TaxID=2949333 RepID=A0ABT1EI15_9FIRM|nr:adenine deaminase [Ohessyouella blattaphilus]MCP1110345.1 adenine deaminase [Ohessyouella blattaphilus]MCR8563739.1 adenine deaminase [Ohessyouella blattaphilus]